MGDYPTWGALARELGAWVHANPLKAVMVLAFFVPWVLAAMPDYEIRDRVERLEAKLRAQGRKIP